MSISPKFTTFLKIRYPVIRSQHPGEGRRKWRLRVAQEFWNLSERDLDALAPSVVSDDNGDEDSDPMDEVTEGDDLGLIVRTDFSNEENWNIFVTKFQNAEKELAESLKNPAPEGTQDSDMVMEGSSADQEGGDEQSSDSESESVPQSIIKVINPEPLHLKLLFEDKSNLAILRLLNDVDVGKAPDPPRDAKPIKPSNRLAGKHGFQEIYQGKNIWIYDAQSNVDECVRVVNQTGDIYGTASGDSWRARVTHICELQFNMAFLGMKIDFGGLDRWDYNERLRNLKEANIEIK